MSKSWKHVSSKLLGIPGEPIQDIQAFKRRADSEIDRHEEAVVTCGSGYSDQ